MRGRSAVLLSSAKDLVADAIASLLAVAGPQPIGCEIAMPARAAEETIPL